jgi:hypothetical protein
MATGVHGRCRTAEESSVTSTLSDWHRANVLHVRGIADWVIDSVTSRYESFEKGEGDKFLHLMGMGYARKTSKPPWKGKVAQSGGIVIERFGVANHVSPPPYARLDSKVAMGRRSTTRYIYRPGYPEKHIDVHPLASERLRAGEPLYFCLEGSLKADAVLSAGGVSISSTSITTWEAPDLGRLLDVLRGAPSVLVIPDSDFYASDKTEFPFNPMVRWQTVMANEWLLARGVASSIRVPWLGVGKDKVGVDDFLHSGRKLQDLSWQAPDEPLDSIDGYPLTTSQAAILRWLIRRFGSAGAFSPSGVAKAVRRAGNPITRRTVHRAYTRFVELGIMQVWPGRRTWTGEAFLTTPHVYQLRSDLSAAYSDWLKALPVPA